MSNKVYLGDGLYFHYDGFQVWLTTLEGMEVALEPNVLQEFFRALEGVYGCKIEVKKDSQGEGQ